MIPADIRSPDIDETPARGELPRPYCMRMARQKAEALDVSEDEILLCADTTVHAGRRILGKPADADEARAFLALLSGRRHRVITAICVRDVSRVLTREVVSTVRMKRLCRDEIEGYVATGDWRGKAGGYAIQGPAGAFVPWIEGSYSAIMGLPVAETVQLLGAAGLSIWEAP